MRNYYSLSILPESTPDMQSITETVSRYYSNNESFDDLPVAPEYQELFERLVSEAIAYYNTV